MKQGPTLFLKAVIAIMAVAVLSVCVFVLPVGIRTDQTGMYKFILMGLYVPAVPFFIALYHAFQLLLRIEKNKVFSELSVRALKVIKYCAFTISGLFIAGMPYIFYVADLDDAPGVAAIGFIIIFASLVIGVAAGVFQKMLQNAVDMKSENDLTV